MKHPVASRAYALIMFLVVSVLCGVLTAGLAVPAAALLGGTAKVGADSLDSLPVNLTQIPQMERSRVLMADGSLLATFYQENRIYVPLTKISPYMQQAQVAIEDHRFFEHGAIDPKGTLRALVRNSSGGSTQGGSTLTQQYVKQALIQQAQAKGDDAALKAATEQTVERKVRELRYAIGVEKELTKAQVLELYLNIAYYGDGAYGVQAAARHFFNKDASQLTLAESAMLAGMVQNPTATNPRFYLDAALTRRNVVLNAMLSLAQKGELWGPALTEADVVKAKKTPYNPKQIKVEPNGCLSSPFPHLCEYVLASLLKMPGLGKTPEDRLNLVKRGGLVVRTLINPKAQRAAEGAILDVVAATDPVDSGSVLIRPKDGLIVAMAQNRTTIGALPAATHYNYNVSERMGGAEGYQAGSTFKAITIAAAIAYKGFTPNKKYNAISPYYPAGQNFGFCNGGGTFTDRKFHVKNSVAGYDNKDITMVQAAQGSVNTYFMQLERDTGLCNVIKMAELLGIETANGSSLRSSTNQVISFTLGSVDVTPLSVARAYATFANRGVRCEPRIVAGVIAKGGKALPVPGPSCKEVMKPAVADGVNYVLQQVMKGRGTGVAARIDGIEYQAGKTGTTENHAAVWFAGYTPQMAGIAYVGIDKNKFFAPYWNTHAKSLQYKVLPSGKYLKGSGSGDAGRIYSAAMEYALQGLPDTPFTDPTDSVMNGKKIEVPSIAGMSYEQAKQTLESAGFSTAKMYQTSQWPAGTYLGYCWPSSGSSVNQDETVYLYFSSGPAPEPTVQPTTKPTSKTTQPTASATSKPAAPTKTQPTKKGNGATKSP